MSTIPIPKGIAPRRAWTTQPHAAALDEKTSRILFVHITESPGRHITSEAARVEAMRALWAFHVKVRGYVDIGYNYVCFEPWESKGPAHLYVARGAERLPAAQQGHNAGNWAVSVVATTEEFIMERTVHALGWLAAHLGAAKVLGHRDATDTTCPGDKLYARLRDVRALQAVYS